MYDIFYFNYVPNLTVFSFFFRLSSSEDQQTKHGIFDGVHVLCRNSHCLSSRATRNRVGVNNGKKERTDQVRTLDWSAD